MSASDELRRWLFTGLHSPRVKPVLERVPVLRQVYGGATWRHPFDRAYGIDTSGIIDVDALKPQGEAARLSLFYAGSQPGVLRRVLGRLPDRAEYTFVDLGCGKGRPLVVASELAFKSIIGVDISPAVLDVARANAKILRERYPERPSIELVAANAYRYVPEADRVVFFLYHPFGREGVVELARSLESKVASGAHLFVVYYNPVWAAVFDTAPFLRRWSAETLPYDRSEIGYGMDVEDSVVVWQSLPERYASHPGADRRVVARTSTRAHLEA